MMEAVRSWLTGIIAVSILTSVAQTLIARGTLRSIASLTCGLLLLVVLLAPLAKLPLGALHLDRDDYTEEIEQRRQTLEAENDQELAELIAEKTQAYILDKAKELGVSCSDVEVTTQQGEGGVPCPCAAELDCAFSAELSAYMEQELGIPKERQVFHGT